jgi:lipoprotein-anchoring transpeptidase ErfK/SrfK
MFLFIGAALVLLGFQWRAWAANSQGIAATSKATTSVKGTQSNGVSTTSRSTFSSSGVSTTASTPLKNSATLVIDLSDRRVYVSRDQQVVSSYPVAIGQAGWETPSGSFQVLEMQRDPKWQHPITGEVIPVGAANPLGKRWIGFLYEGLTHIGFHGTNQEELIGQAVSHGCVRMRNRDVVALYDQIALGTSVTVRP